MLILRAIFLLLIIALFSIALPYIEFHLVMGLMEAAFGQYIEPI